MRVKILLFFIFTAALSFAQVPKLINYQGIVRGVDGTPVLNQAVSLRFQILRGSPTGSVVFTEAQSVTTNSLGLIQTQIGINNTNLGNINWNNGQYFLEVAADIAGGSDLTVLGTQQILGVPYSFHASTVPATYSAATNVLNVGGNTFTLASTPVTSVTASGIASVSSTGINTFVVSVPQPTFTANGPVKIIGTYPNYSVTAATPTITGTGNISITNPTTSVYVANVPFMQVTTTNTTGLPGVSGSGTNSVNINIPPQSLPTITGTGLAIVSSSGLNFNVGVPLLTYNNTTGVLSSGTNAITVAPLLTFNNGILTSGPAANSVNLGSIAPWRQGVNTVTLTSITDRVGIGTNAPTENLQVESTTSGSLSVLSGVVNTSDLSFGTSANHSLGRLRYDNATGTMAFWTASAVRATLNNVGQMVIGSGTPVSANTGLTVSRPGAFNNQVVISGGDNSNFYGGILSLAENLNAGQGMSLRLDAGGNRLWITNDVAGNSPVAAFGGYSGGSVNGMVIGSAYSLGTNPPTEGLAIQGFLGVGTANPGTRLEVNGDISIPNGNKVQFGTLSSGSGIGEWIQNSGFGLQFNTSSLPRMYINNSGQVGINTSAPSAQLHVNGTTNLQGNTNVGASAAAPSDLRVFGAARMGTESGNTQGPNYPSGSTGMIMRRVYNTLQNSVAVLARTNYIAFELDGTNGGFRVTVTSGGSSIQTCHCTGVTTAGVTLSKAFTNLNVGTTQIYTNAENMGQISCLFGDPVVAGHMTEITISRYSTDYFWMGHLISTFNQ